jgi:hypothetical protein
VSAGELVRVRVLAHVTLGLNPVLSVLSVLRWVKLNLLQVWLGLGLARSCLFGFFLGLFFSLLLGVSLLLSQLLAALELAIETYM